MNKKYNIYFFLFKLIDQLDHSIAIEFRDRKLKGMCVFERFVRFI